MGTPQATTTFRQYLQRHLDDRGWTRADLSRSASLAESGIGRWMAGENKPTIDNCRALAETLARPLLEVLLAADLLKPDEVKDAVIPLVDLAALSNEELLAEVRRRMGATAEVYRPTSGEAAADSVRFEGVKPVSKTKPRPAPKRKTGP